MTQSIGTAIVALNSERVPQLGQGWGLSIVMGISCCAGVVVMVLPNVIRSWKELVAGLEPDLFLTVTSWALMVTFVTLPVILVGYPAHVTDKCVQLETRLSDLLIPNDPTSSEGGRYVVSYETSQQLRILDKYMQKQNNRQGSASLRCLCFVRMRNLCARSGFRHRRTSNFATILVAAGCGGDGVPRGYVHVAAQLVTL